VIVGLSLIPPVFSTNPVLMTSQDLFQPNLLFAICYLPCGRASDELA
jgi:hypothetical protein